MFKNLAIASIALVSASARVFVSYDIAEKDDYAGSTVSPAYDGKVKAAFSRKK